jgi:hypothetical protein
MVEEVRDYRVRYRLVWGYNMFGGAFWPDTADMVCTVVSWPLNSTQFQNRNQLP